MTTSKMALLDSNIVWGNVAPNKREMVGGAWTRSIVGAENEMVGGGELVGDPQFKDAAGGDYHLATCRTLRAAMPAIRTPRSRG